jgi:CspA family cold shock protein
MSETLKGVVKWFNDAKGFGFIEHTSGKDVFVHYSVIEVDGFKTLKDGEEVEYEMKEGPKGLQAVKVQRSGQPAGSEDASEEPTLQSSDTSTPTDPSKQEDEAEADLDD